MFELTDCVSYPLQVGFFPKEYVRETVPPVIDEQ